MSEMITVARPYAKAAFEFAVESQNLDSWHEMLVFAAEVAKNQDMKAFLSGSVSADKMAEVFSQVCGEQLNDKGQNLVKIMAENGRLPVLPAVVDLFAEMHAEYSKEISVEVTSAVELVAAQVDKLSAALEKRLERKVNLNCSVDANVVGGLVIKAGDVVIDSTIRGKLNRLTETLQS
jgi:F-type H+-transporting ATPase subunit delta